MKNIARYITVTLLVLTGIITATAQDIFLPDDPGRSTPHHKLKIVSTEANNIIIEVYTHSANGYFDMMYDDVNISHSDANISMTLAEGDSIKIWNSTYSWSGWEYTYMEMDGKKIHENQHLASYGDNEMPTFVMPNHDATIYVYATFDPSTPGVEQADNPYCGMWNAETGELFVNNFVPYIPDYHTGYYGMGKDGYLLVGAINRAVYDYNISKADVRILTVSGEMGHGNDNIALENVHTLDLRHTYGYKSYYGLWYDNKTWYDNIFDQYVFSSALRRLILPSNIQGLSDGAFEGWNGEWKLEELTCYAVTPPMVNDNTLTPLPSTCVLCVPEQSVAVYKADKNWSRFKTIKGIQEAEDVTVDLPDNFTDGRYRGMSLELLNAENGESRKYIIDERGQYVYRGLVSGARYTALLRSPKNGIIAQTDTMLLDNQPIEMTFPKVVGMDEVLLTVKADGKDVTSDVTIGWTDRKGASLGSGPKLDQQIEGSRVYYSIKLPSQLASLYQQPPTTDHIVGTNRNVIALDLLPLDSVSISGVVKDAEGNRIGGATVVIAQTVNGQISKSFVTTTDGSGRFALKALAGPVARSVSLAGYITNRQELTLSSEKTTTDTITLAPLSGAVISYDFTYTESGLTGEAVTTLPSYSDYQNVGITAYNATTRKELTDISVQYPQVVILSGAKKGDRIRLTATSLAGSFKTVEQSVTISDDETANVTIPIVQYGGIEASFQQTDNTAVTASLYDASGKLYQTYNYDEATIRMTEIPDGNYTLVTMGGSTLFSSIQSLSDYATIGLKEGTDYVKNEVTVKSGEIVTVSNTTIPVLNESSYYYTDETATSFAMNKTEVNAGFNVTLRSQITFKSAYRQQVSNINLIVDLPENAQMVEGSAMTGTKMTRSTVSGNRVTIPISTADLDKYTRFVVTATNSGTLSPTGYVQFDMDGRTILQPIGSPVCEVKGITVNVPERICDFNLPATGTAPARSFITLYANDVEVAQTTAREDGSWSVYAELPQLPNLAAIAVRSKITTRQGLEISSEVATTRYDQDYVRVDHVYVYHGSQVVDFDFNHPETIDEQYLVTELFASGFTFAVEFNTSDSTKVKNVELDVKDFNGDWYALTPEYDSRTGRWIVYNNTEFNRGNPPVNVIVDYTPETGTKMDGDVLSLTANALDYIKQGIKDGNDDISDKVDAIVNEHDRDKQLQLINEFFAEMGIDPDTPVEEPTMTAEQWMAELDSHFSENGWNSHLLDNADIYSVDMGQNIKVSHAAGLSESELISQGYEAMPTTAGGNVYQLYTDNKLIIVDIANDLKLEFTLDNNMAAVMQAIRRGPSADALAKVQKFMGDMNNAWAVLSPAIDEVKKACGTIIATFIKPQLEWAAKQIVFNRGILISYNKAGAAIPVEVTKHMKELQEEKQFLQKMMGFFTDLGEKGPDIGGAIKCFADAKLGKFSGFVKKVVDFGTKVDVGKFFAWTTIIADVWEGVDRVNKLLKIWSTCPNPCRDDKANAARIEGDISGFLGGALLYYVATVFADAYSITSISTGTLTPPAGLVLAISGVVATCTKVALSIAYGQMFDQKMDWWKKEISMLECDRTKVKQRNMKIREDYLKDRQKFIRDLNAAIDPSGFIYEGVTDNRVENAITTIYYKWEGEDEYGDIHNEAVKWDAAAYGQQNPLLTDAEGKYQWDVPKGLWQVKVEKDGYETAYSEWLPVPPPQLDVNIGIVQKSLPDVKTARAYEDGIEVEFNKYMRPGTLNTQNIWLTQGSQKLACTIEQLNAGKNWAGDSAYVSRLLIRPMGQLSVDSKIGLFIRRQVESYAGLQMQNDYEQEFTVVREIRSLEVEPNVDVDINHERSFVVRAYPAAAASGKTVKAVLNLSGFVGINSEATFDANGEAQFTVNGLMPGESVATFTIDDSYASAHATVRVLSAADAGMVAVPTASRISGTSVNSGETVTLHCATEGAQIWYTLDGSCPCDENGTRQLYTAPITITADMELKAYAVRGEDASEVVSFTYYIATGMDAVQTASQKVPTAYYSPNGQRLLRPQKGINIVLYEDGTTRKIVVK